MKKNEKPNLILELEKTYGITLEEVYNIYQGGYVLDKDNNIVGLNLSNNQISDIESIKELKSLQKLDLSDNQISDIESIKELKSLQKLDLSDNQISDIESIKELKSLQKLDLSRNQISDIKSIKELKSLQTLYLWSNQISDIKSIKELKSLQTLYLWSNQISDIKSIKELKSLQTLYLSRNQINDIESIKELKSLQELDLSDNQISDIESIKELKSLQELDLSYNKINDIESIKELKSLQELDLSDNQISDIKSIKELKSLQTLYLSNNQISDIESIKELKSLQALYLWSNQISDIKSIKELKSLQTLYLSNNQISDIKSIKELKSLQTLYLSNNQISDIESIKELKSLQKLDLSRNQISDMKSIKELKSLPELDELRIYKNPFLEELIDFKLDETYDSNNLQDLKDYFQGISSKSAKDIKSIKKIMLVGNHSSGKSEFLNHFIEDNSQTGSTHILNIVSYPNNENKKAIIYDFGGQDYYHGIYKAFMTNHATSLIFWKKQTDNNTLSDDESKRNEKTQNFTKDYWIKQLWNFDENYNSNGDKKDKEKVLLNRYWLIQTHIDDDGVEFLDNKILSKKIYRQFHINNKNTNDIDLDSLKKHLKNEIDNSEMIKKLPIDIAVEKYIFEQNSPDAIEISAIVDKFPDAKERINFILNQLARQGLILYYPHNKELSKIAWLNPSKTLKKIHDEIFDVSSLSTYKGRVPKDKFGKLCNDENLVLMLIENKVIFSDDISNEKYYIVPSYLPRINEDSSDFLYIFDIQTPCITLKFEYFIPFGFMNRLISIYGRTPDIKKYWKDVLLFTLNNKHIKVFIRLDFEELKIKLYVIGDNKTSKKDIDETQKYLFEEILMLYNDIEIYESKLYPSRKENEIEQNKHKENNEILEKRLQTKKVIPDDLYISLNNKHFVHYKTLEDEEKTKEQIIAFNIKEKQINKENSIVLSTRAFKNISDNKEISKMKKIFISYSRKDIDFRDELRKHLSVLKFFDLADNWACEDIQIGKWHDQIQRELEESDLIIYMLSANFFTSAYILEEEVVKGMEMIAQNTNKKILPVIVSDFVGLDKLGSAIKNPTEKQEAILGLGKFQYLAYGKNINPLTKQSEETILSLKDLANRNELDKGLSQIVERIIQILK